MCPACQRRTRPTEAPPSAWGRARGRPAWGRPPDGATRTRQRRDPPQNPARCLPPQRAQAQGCEPGRMERESAPQLPGAWAGGTPRPGRESRPPTRHHAAATTESRWGPAPLPSRGRARHPRRTRRTRRPGRAGRWRRGRLCEGRRGARGRFAPRASFESRGTSPAGVRDTQPPPQPPPLDTRRPRTLAPSPCCVTPLSLTHLGTHSSAEARRRAVAWEAPTPPRSRLPRTTRGSSLLGLR